MRTRFIHSVDTIIGVVSEYYGIPIDVLKNPSIKIQKVTDPRHVAMYLARKFTYKSVEQIVEAFNQKERHSVVNAFAKISRLAVKDSDLHQSINEVEAILELEAAKGDQ